MKSVAALQHLLEFHTNFKNWFPTWRMLRHALWFHTEDRAVHSCAAGFARLWCKNRLTRLCVEWGVTLICVWNVVPVGEIWNDVWRVWMLLYVSAFRYYEMLLTSPCEALPNSTTIQQVNTNIDVVCWILQCTNAWKAVAYMRCDVHGCTPKQTD